MKQNAAGTDKREIARNEALKVESELGRQVIAGHSVSWDRMGAAIAAAKECLKEKEAAAKGYSSPRGRAEIATLVAKITAAEKALDVCSAYTANIRLGKIKKGTKSWRTGWRSCNANIKALKRLLLIYDQTLVEELQLEKMKPTDSGDDRSDSDSNSDWDDDSEDEHATWSYAQMTELKLKQRKVAHALENVKRAEAGKFTIAFQKDPYVKASAPAAAPKKLTSVQILIKKKKTLTGNQT